MYILTFNFQVGLAREIVALPDDAGVSSAVIDLRIFDDQGKRVFIDYERKFFALVAFLQI